MTEGTPIPGWGGVDSPKVEWTCEAGTLTIRTRKTHTMLRAGQSLRFTPQEVEEFRLLGLDFEGAQTPDDVEQALAAWAQTLDRDRPALLEKIVAEMASAKGVRLPARLTVVGAAIPSSGSLRRS